MSIRTFQACGEGVVVQCCVTNDKERNLVTGGMGGNFSRKSGSYRDQFKKEFTDCWLASRRAS